MRKGKIAFIVEGPVKEKQIFENIKKNFFMEVDIEIVDIPARQNLYMIYIFLIILMNRFGIHI